MLTDRPSRYLAHPMREFGWGHAHHHRARGIVGVVLCGLALIAVLMALPDAIRYIKMSRM